MTIQIEWPLLAQGRQNSEQALDAWRGLLRAVLADPVVKGVPVSVHAVLLQDVEQVQAARYQRLAQSQKHGDPLRNGSQWPVWARSPY